MTKFLTRWYPLLLTLVVAAALRIQLLTIRGTLWFDEMFSVHFSSLPWGQALHLWSLETNPPLYLLFLRWYLRVIGQQPEWLIRLPSLVFSLLALVALFLFSERLFSRRVAGFASLFFALSQIQIILGTETRSYSLLSLLTIISSYLFYRQFIQNSASRSLWWSAILIDTLLLYTHLTATVLIAVQYLALIALPPE